ncbi:MAG: hypothetical protein WC615_00200 [Mucilaginibacter sp.]|jgi:hypothetical protein|uniref:hypothetical protein n=1 Tax=Mucilaginibacter sp. TaxID=1882438 RepID=UPI00356A4188
METPEMDAFFKDQGSTQPIKRSQICMCPLCSRFEEAIEHFLDDLFFLAVVKSLDTFKANYRSQPVAQAIDTIAYYLQLCNVGIIKSGFESQEDLFDLSKYLYFTKVCH